MRWREISSSQVSCSMCKFCQRLESAAARSRKCTLAISLACAATAPHAGREEFNWLMTCAYSCSLLVMVGKIPVSQSSPHCFAGRGLVEQGEDVLMGSRFFFIGTDHD